MGNKKLSAFTLADVIRRQIAFIKSELIFKNEDFEDWNAGKLLALDEMLLDIDKLKENDFLDKYLTIMDELNKKYELGGFSEGNKANFLSGYTTAILDVMICIEPEFEFVLEDYFSDLHTNL